MNYHFLPQETYAPLGPRELGLAYGSVQRLKEADGIRLESGGRELCLVCIGGQTGYRCGRKSGTAVMNDMLYVPVDTVIELDNAAGQMVCFGAPCTRQYEFAHIPFAQVDGDSRHKVYGKAENGTLRDVWNFIDESFPSGRLLTGICMGRDGGWTAWPPHEHAREREELYVYYGMGDSFGVQLVYDHKDHPYTTALVRDGHLVAIPRGYHPNCGCPGGGIHYVYCMVSTEEGERQFMDLRTETVFGDKLE